MLIKKHSPQWPIHFQALKRAIEIEFAGVAHKFEHVGSTAVPGLDAKAIIDIDIVFFAAHDFEAIKSGLIALGYFHNGDQGITGREVFKRADGGTHAVLDSIPHHLYVCHSDSEELHRHLLFRDYLRKNEDARQEYQEIKYELARKANQNKRLYANLKEVEAAEFIRSVIELAKDGQL